MRNKNLSILVEGAMMIALATVLSYIKVWESPYGGSVTLEMLPLVIIGLRRGPKWGLLVGFTHGLIQMLMGFNNVLYCDGLLAQIGCILLDYVLAFAVLGLAGVFAEKFDNLVAGASFGAFVAAVLRYICSVLSGWLLWGSYAWEGWNPALYSIAYNAVYMVPSTIILVAVVAVLAKSNGKLISKQD